MHVLFPCYTRGIGLFLSLLVLGGSDSGSRASLLRQPQGHVETLEKDFVPLTHLFLALLISAASYYMHPLHAPLHSDRASDISLFTEITSIRF